MNEEEMNERVRVELEKSLGKNKDVTAFLGIVLLGIIFLCSIVGVSLYAVMMFLVLQQIHATTIMWVLYWCYIPVAFVMCILSQVAQQVAKEFKE